VLVLGTGTPHIVAFETFRTGSENCCTPRYALAF